MTTEFILGFHCHQPLGNFDEVMLEAAEKAYLPLLRALDAHRDVKVALHFSGCLLEWAEAKAPEVVDRVGALAARGQAELLGGGFYEPLLPIVPEADAIAQVDALRVWIGRRFGVKARGIWLAERVWEPSLAATLARAGVEYLPVDDTHLLGAGLREADLTGAWRTGEDGGSVVLYPIRETLRYLIPFQPVAESIEWLRRLGEGSEHALAVMADDGEKFGVWPGTSEWVFGQGWLESFLRALEENRSWLRTMTFAERHDEREPVGSIHVPAASYFEMGEWALPVGAGRALRESVANLRKEGRFAAVRPFLKGGNWRYFLTKYPEAGHRLDRVRALSSAIEGAMVTARARDAAAAAGRAAGATTAASLPAGGVSAVSSSIAAARDALWRSECNCSYWHGVFGGIYLPFLRDASEGALVRARRLHEETVHPPGPWLVVTPASGRDRATGRLRIDNPRLGLTADAALGGALLDLEYKPLDVNVAAVMPRREEIYHDELARAPEKERPPAPGTPSIHDRPATGGRAPVARFVYDAAPRLALLDHLYEGRPGAADLMNVVAHEVSLGPWRRGSSSPAARFSEILDPHRVRLLLAAPSGVLRRKELDLDAQAASLVVRYEIAAAEPSAVEAAERAGGAPGAPGPRVTVGPEIPAALWEAHGRILWTPRGGGAAREEPLSSPVDLDEAASVVLTNDVTGLRMALEPSAPAAIRAFPLRTISRSESGYDEIYQGTIVQVLWDVPAPGEPPARTTLLLRLFKV